MAKFRLSLHSKRIVTARINHAASRQTKSGRVPTDEHGRHTNMISSAGGAAAGVGTGVALANRALKLSTKLFRVKSHARRKLERIPKAGEGREEGCPTRVLAGHKTMPSPVKNIANGLSGKVYNEREGTRGGRRRCPDTGGRGVARMHSQLLSPSSSTPFARATKSAVDIWQFWRVFLEFLQLAKTG